MNYLLLLFFAAFGLFYYDTLSWLVGSWINNEYYSQGFLVPVISGYLIWNLRKELAIIEKKQSQTGLAVLAIGILLQAIGVLWSIRFISGISLLVTVYGMILYLFGWEVMKKISFPLLFLVLMIPLPLADIIAPPTQTLSAIGTLNVAKLAGMPVEREGLVLKIPEGSFEVAYACSGLNSIISLLTIAVIYAYILEGGMIMKLTIIISSIPLALAGNIMRITSVLVVANKYGQETALNYFHEVSSLLLFCVVLVGLFLVGGCFGRLRFKKIF
jgi:exosortase